MSQVNRRRFVLAAAALFAAGRAAAQQSPDRGYLIGILHEATRADSEPDLVAFREGLREGGVDVQNLRFEFRFADYDYRKLDRLAEGLVRAKVQVIYAPTTCSVYAAQAATKTIPIVFSGVNDPVRVKLVQSLARPGGNITGVTSASNDLTAKRVQLMRELFPGAGRLGVVYDEDAARACNIELSEIGNAGKKLGVEVRQFSYAARTDLEGAFEKAERANIAALLIPTTYEARRFGAELALQSTSSRIPMVHSGSEWVDAGGLMSYGPVRDWSTRRAGYYVARILKGAKPSDLPVELPTRYELVINLKTARAMGVTVPQSVLLRADRVIE